MASLMISVVKRLFARCQNRCAYPDCVAPIVEDSGIVTGDICHIKAASVGGPRYDAAQTDSERNAADNLMLLCTRHHRIVDTDVGRHPAPVLTEMKRLREQGGVVEISAKTARAAKGLLATYLNLTAQSNSGQIAVNSPGAVQANTLNLKVTKHKISVAAPAGSVGSDQAMTSYVTYLIARYQEFQKGHTSKMGQFKYIALHTALRRQFKGEWKLLPSAKFEALVEFLHRRIDNTLIGRRNSAKGVASYRSFSEHG